MGRLSPHKHLNKSGGSLPPDPPEVYKETGWFKEKEVQYFVLSLQEEDIFLSPRYYG